MDNTLIPIKTKKWENKSQSRHELKTKSDETEYSFKTNC